VDEFLPGGEVWEILVQARGLKEVMFANKPYEDRCDDCIELDDALRAIEKAMLSNST